MCYRFFVYKYFLIFTLVYRFFIVYLYQICIGRYLIRKCALYILITSY
jgi:hypothetical protein